MTGPDLRSGKEAAAYAAELRRIMVLLGVLDTDMQVSQHLCKTVELAAVKEATGITTASHCHVNRHIQVPPCTLIASEASPDLFGHFHMTSVYGMLFGPELALDPCTPDACPAHGPAPAIL